MELGDSEKKLLEFSAKDVLKQLNVRKSVHSVKMKAFQFLLDNDEEVQVQVIVTRNEPYFLDDFETEITNDF